MNNVSSPRTDDESIEQAIQRKGLTGPRVTPKELEDNITDVEIVKHVSHGGQVLRWAVLTTRSGFAVTGRPSVSVSPENDDSEIGVAVATANAKDELWPLMGYALKERLAPGPAAVPFHSLPRRGGARPQLQMTLTFDDKPENGVLARLRPPSGWQLQALIRDEETSKQAAVFRVDANEPPPADWLRLFTGLVEWSVFGPDGVHGDTRTA